MKSLRIVFYSLLLIFLTAFLFLIHSTFVTKKVFEYVSHELPIKFSSVNGTLYSGIKIVDLNYDDMIKIEEFYIKPSLLSLLVKEIFIYDLKINKITLEDKFLESLSSSNEENSEEFVIPFSLFIKNLEASLYNFNYEDYQVEEFLLTSKDLSSDLKENLSANLEAKIKSNLIDLETKIDLKNNNYKLNAKLDLKKEVINDFYIQATGDLNKVDFEVENKKFTLKEDNQIIDIENLLINGNYDIKNSNLEISNLSSLVKYEEISSNIIAKASMLNNDIDSLIFDIDLQTTIKKSIYEALQKDLQLKSNFTGNLKEIKFLNNIESNQLNIEKNPIKIENSSVNGNIKIDDKNIDIFADFNLKSNLANKKSKIEVKINKQNIENLSIKAKSTLENLKYENLDLKSIGNITINSSYKKDNLDINLDSKIATFDIKSKDFKRFIFDLDIKQLNPNEFYELDKSIKISKLKGKIKGEFDENLSLKGDLILNDSLLLNAILNTKNNDLEATIKNNSFLVKVDKKENQTKIKSQIKELKDLEKELSKILDFSTLNLSGLVDVNISIDELNTNFEINSPKISIDKEKIEKISIKGNFSENKIFFDKLDFNIFEIYEINLQKNFVLKKRAFFDIDSFDGEFTFDNIILKSSKNDKNIILSINTKDLFLAHSSYGSGFLNSDIFVDINEENKILIGGELKVDKLTVLYQAPSMSISKDKDIIIVSKNKKFTQKDTFYEDIALELSIFGNNINYNVKNIDLNASTVLYLKKEFSSGIRIYGSVQDVSGTFSELGKNYNIKNSAIYFRGLDPIDPILDIHALNKLNDVDISIVIGGTLNYPRINLHSTPIMSQKDILSYLIFGTRFSADSQANTQSKQSQASLFLLNELSKDYAKELGLDMIYFQYDPKTQYIETHVGKNISQKSKIVLKNKSDSGQLILMRELTKLWNVELGFEQNTQSLDLIYRRRY